MAKGVAEAGREESGAAGWRRAAKLSAHPQHSPSRRRNEPDHHRQRIEPQIARDVCYRNAEGAELGRAGNDALKLLAQGDSWFSINGLSLFAASSLLMRLKFNVDTAIVNCAGPADTLKHMVEWRRDPFFFRHFAAGAGFEENWDGLLLSGGGNDLIDALAVLPHDRNGVPRMTGERLLLTRSERAETGSVGRYVSREGWTAFREHMLSQYRALDTLRASSAKNRNVPIFTHCYAYAQPRNVGAGPLGPWLFPSLLAYEVPPTDWLELTRHFIDLLHDEIIAEAGLENFHVLDSCAMAPPRPLPIRWRRIQTG